MTSPEAKVEERAEAPAVTASVEELPSSIVRRVVKEKLSQLSSAREGSEVTLQREAVLAFSESARIFIHYLSATANDICRESKRQTINSEDVFKALEEIEFAEFIGPLRGFLDDYRQKNTEKKNDRKRKTEPSLSNTRTGDVDGEEEHEEDTGGHDGSAARDVDDEEHAEDTGGHD